LLVSNSWSSWLCFPRSWDYRCVSSHLDKTNLNVIRE
jgi:hypothetical protein